MYEQENRGFMALLVLMAVSKSRTGMKDGERENETIDDRDGYIEIPQSRIMTW